MEHREIKNARHIYKISIMRAPRNAAFLLFDPAKEKERSEKEMGGAEIMKIKNANDACPGAHCN